MAPAARKKILIICALDGFANSVRPSKIEEHLRARGHEVEVVDILEAERSRSALRKITPAFVQQLGSQLLMRRRARRLERLIRQKRPDVVICETYTAAYALTKKLPSVTIYDAPLLFADESLFGGRVSRPVNALQRRTELEIFKRVDHLTFHWESYNEYVDENYKGERGFTGDNMFVLNWGCTPRPRHAKFASPPRIAYLGSLHGYWVNLPLLVALARQYPIDVYGGPPPDEKLGLNYCGYAPLDVLLDYQFGLLTITDDPLRRAGFSAKHLEYVAYGLPVLCPEWRQDRRLANVTIPFTEANFLDQVDRYSNPDSWQEIHEQCIKTASELAWERTLRPLDALIETGDPRQRQPS
jgi:hypothetical protein